MKDKVTAEGIDLRPKWMTHSYTIRAKDLHAETDDFNPDCPLYGKYVVFTGALQRMTRREAMQATLDIGGLCSDSVTKKTNFLVLGNNDYCKSIKGGKSNKQKKAEALQLAGLDIHVISENTFYEMLESE
jgi:DNA polymerase-3 subunit epsilon